jgi:hypothetical protein
VAGAVCPILNFALVGKFRVGMLPQALYLRRNVGQDSPRSRVPPSSPIWLEWGSSPDLSHTIPEDQASGGIPLYIWRGYSCLYMARILLPAKQSAAPRDNHAALRRRTYATAGLLFFTTVGSAALRPPTAWLKLKSVGATPVMSRAPRLKVRSWMAH